MRFADRCTASCARRRFSTAGFDGCTASKIPSGRSRQKIPQTARLRARSLSGSSDLAPARFTAAAEPVNARFTAKPSRTSPRTTSTPGRDENGSSSADRTNARTRQPCVSSSSTAKSPMNPAAPKTVACGSGAFELVDGGGSMSDGKGKRRWTMESSQAVSRNREQLRERRRGAANSSPSREFWAPIGSSTKIVASTVRAALNPFQ